MFSLDALDIDGPECSTCDDRGRVWDGPDGATKACPKCAVWGVWLTHIGGQGWSDCWWSTSDYFDETPPTPILLTRRQAERRAERDNAVDPEEAGMIRMWRSEARRFEAA